MQTLVDGVEPLTFGILAARFVKLGMTEGRYREFRLPLDYKDVTNYALADEIVGYRSLIGWYRGSFDSRHTRKSVPRPRISQVDRTSQAQRP
jgi:hypothetical protein